MTIVNIFKPACRIMIETRMDLDTQKDMGIIKEAVLKELQGVVAIYLFGSVAKGTEHEKSDYDVVIFTQKNPDDLLDAIARLRFGVSKKIKRPLEPFIIKVDDLEHPSPLLYEIYTNNYLIYGDNVISRCRDIIKNIRPIIKDGRKIGYYV